MALIHLNDLMRNFFGGTGNVNDAEATALSALQTNGVNATSLGGAAGVTGTLRTAGGEDVISRELINSATTAIIPTQTLMLTSFVARKTEAITKVRVVTGTQAAAATPTIARIGIYSVDATGGITLITATPNDTTLFAAVNTPYLKSLSATWNKVGGTRYALGILTVSGVTMPNFISTLPVAFAVAGGGLQLLDLPWVCAFQTGQADLPVSTLIGSLTAPFGGYGPPLFTLVP